MTDLNNELPKALRDKGLTKASDNLKPGQEIRAESASTFVRIFFREELTQFLERYRKPTLEIDQCQVSEESTAGREAANDSYK